MTISAVTVGRTEMLGVDPVELPDSTDLTVDLQLDSLQRLEVTAWMADRGVDVDQLSTGRPRTVQEARALLEVATGRRNGLRFDLYVRGGANMTTLSGPLQDAITSGQINLRFIP